MYPAANEVNGVISQRDPVILFCRWAGELFAEIRAGEGIIDIKMLF